MRGRCGSGTGRGNWQRAGRAGGVGRAEVGERGRVSGAGPCGRLTGRWERKTGPSGREPGWSVRGCAGLPEVALVDLGVGREQALG